MMGLACFMLQWAGFAALAISMPKHHRDLFGRAPSRRASLVVRGAGWALLALAFVPAIAAAGSSTGIVLWFALATLTALIVALMLTYRERGWSA